MTLQHKQLYEDMMEAYLACRINADELVRTFFEQRRTDTDSDWAALDGRPWEPSPEKERWAEIFSRLFNACEDVDLSEGNGETPEPYWIDEQEFRKRIGDTLQIFKDF